MSMRSSSSTAVRPRGFLSPAAAPPFGTEEGLCMANSRLVSSIWKSSSSNNLPKRLSSMRRWVLGFATASAASSASSASASPSGFAAGSSPPWRKTRRALRFSFASSRAARVSASLRLTLTADFFVPLMRLSRSLSIRSWMLFCLCCSNRSGLLIMRACSYSF